MMKLDAAYQAAINVNEKGLLDPRQFNTIDMAMAAHLKCRGAQAWWDEIKPFRPDRLAARMDPIVADYSGPPFSEALAFYSRPD